jgi:hypothetical protein
MVTDLCGAKTKRTLCEGGRVAEERGGKWPNVTIRTELGLLFSGICERF